MQTLLDERSDLIPSAGHDMTATTTPGCWVHVFPSEHDGFYFVGGIERDCVGEPSAAVGTKRPIHRSQVRDFIRDVMKVDLTSLEWDECAAEPRKFNDYLYATHEQHVRCAILGKTT